MFKEIEKSGAGGGNHNDERSITVAFQGEPGAFSEDAARQLLGTGARTLPCRAFEQVFEAVIQGRASHAVVPIENSLAGSVHKNYDLLLEHDLTIVGETKLRIVHNLIALEGVRLEDVKRVYSHPVALAQCERFIRSHPEFEASAVYDTAGSVKMIVEGGRRDEAGIAGASAAATYGARILVEGIEDNAENFTRFLLLTSSDHKTSLDDPRREENSDQARKTSLVFRIGNKPGALFRALGVFALRDIDLLKIESRPIEGRPWEYSFYLDLSGDASEPNVERALAHLEEMTESLKVLGSYNRSR
jgi:prephenate dehydratase